jgi:uncharacterized protein with HEPN domain
MPPEVLKLLRDMRDAAYEIAEFTDGKTLDHYLREKQLRRAVERAFEILGEALSQLRKIDAKTAESITDWRAIIGFRNVLIHGYGQVNHEKTWDIVQTELPVLRREVDELLAK